MQCLHIHTTHGYTVIKPKQKHVEYYIILHIWFIISNQLAEDIISKLVKSRFNHNYLTHVHGLLKQNTNFILYVSFHLKLDFWGFFIMLF